MKTSSSKLLSHAVALFLIGIVGLVASPNEAMAQNAGSRVHLGAVTTPENCPAFGDGGSGDYVRNFGNTTPWSENPFLNPCWPN